MDLRTGHRRTTCGTLAGRVAYRNRWRRLTHACEPRRQLTRRATRRIGLGVMGVVNDLPLWNEPRGHFCKLLQKYHGESEVADGEHATRAFPRPTIDLGVVRVRHSGRADHDVRAPLERREDVRLCNAGLRVLEEDIAR